MSYFSPPAEYYRNTVVSSPYWNFGVPGWGVWNTLTPIKRVGVGQVAEPPIPVPAPAPAPSGEPTAITLSTCAGFAFGGLVAGVVLGYLLGKGA
jgi:hypothetical protein